MRRRALSVPQPAQRIYIVRANQAVMSALKPSIPISTTRFSNRSFKPCISPAGPSGNAARVRSRAGMPGCQHPRVKR